MKDDIASKNIRYMLPIAFDSICTALLCNCVSMISCYPYSIPNKPLERLLAIFKSPVFYIVVGAFIALIIFIYLLRRFTRASSDSVVVITRKGKIRKILKENDGVYYRVPFVDSIGAVILLTDKTFTSERLFINDGPNHLYRYKYTFVYKVINPETCFNHLGNIQETIEIRINDSLRLFADNGNAQTLICNYRSSENEILKVINDAINDLGIEASGFKVDYIEPMGK